MIGEREVTKLIELVMDIHKHLGIRRHEDLELNNMQKATDIEHLTEAARTVETRDNSN
jgi:acyl carrier protein